VRKSSWTPSIVPNGTDQSIYKVEDDLGRNSRVWPGADSEKTDLETVIADLLIGQYKDPVRVIGFNTAAGWSEDVSADVAQELRRRCDEQMRDIPFFLIYAGKVDNGFDNTSARELQPRLAPLVRKTQPYARKIAHRAIWVEPSLLAEIEYRAKSAEGKLRHPFYKGVREDF
jgi:hypothetical protein